MSSSSSAAPPLRAKSSSCCSVNGPLASCPVNSRGFRGAIVGSLSSCSGYSPRKAEPKPKPKRPVLTGLSLIKSVTLDKKDGVFLTTEAYPPIVDKG